jgi:hypothetical protein
MASYPPYVEWPVPPGATIVSIDRWTLAEELWSFGEDDLYRVPLEMADEDMIRLWLAAGETYVGRDARSGGEAAAMALVTMVEGRPRPVARRRRRPQAQRPVFSETPEHRLADVRRIERQHSFPHRWNDPAE